MNYNKHIIKSMNHYSNIEEKIHNMIKIWKMNILQNYQRRKKRKN